MRLWRVRLCLGCDRMLPSRDLIRIARVDKAKDVGVDSTGGGSIPEGGDLGEVSTKSKNKGESKNNARQQFVVALDVSSLRLGDLDLAKLVAPNGPCDALTDEHDESAHAAHAMADGTASYAQLVSTTDGANDDASNDASQKIQSKKTILPRRLQGRSLYLCRRGYCARKVVKTKGIKRALRVGNADLTVFHEALVLFCVAAEKNDGVDSSNWKSVREPGAPSRWEEHAVIVDSVTGREVATETATRLGVAERRTAFGGGASDDSGAPTRR